MLPELKEKENTGMEKEELRRFFSVLRRFSEGTFSEGSFTRPQSGNTHLSNCCVPDSAHCFGASVNKKDKDLCLEYLTF